jgi:hypothetical protein
MTTSPKFALGPGTVPGSVTVRRGARIIAEFFGNDAERNARLFFDSFRGCEIDASPVSKRKRKERRG